MTRKQFWPVMMAMALIFAMMIAGCDSGSSSPSPGDNPNTNNSKAGIYLGIIGFNDDLKVRDISLLDDKTKNDFQSFINSMQMEKGTALYYAVDNAINRLKTANLRNDVMNVSIVTFTDGLDNVSSILNSQYPSPDAYRDAIQNRIKTEKIKNLEINAYSIGMKGPDVTDNDAFTKGINALASKPENAKELSNMTDVNKTFSDLAASLSTQSRSQSIKLKIPAGYKDGTKMRFTFDNITDASRSNLYIEGTYKRGSPLLLQEVVYTGLTSESGPRVTGKVVEKVFVEFTFENVSTSSGGNVPINNTKQFFMTESGWQINSEFGGDENTDITTVTKSCVIILVLDCTTSLGNNNFSSMKTAANGFINVLSN